MKLVNDGRPVDTLDLADRYGDPSALGRMATSAGLPDTKLPPTAAEVDPTPPNPGPCPHCGQERPNPVNTFATGGNSRAPLGSFDVDV
jgi:hypothetical protein